MEYSQNIKGQERYSQARSVDKNFQGTETLNSFRNSNQFGRGLGPDPKRVSVTKAAPNDTKLEGFSIPKNKPPGQTFSAPIAKGIENDFINNLQQQIYLSELEIKMLKDQENARANKFMGGLEAGPLTENLVMLKGKYKKIEEDLQSKINELTHENRELMAKNNTSNINYSRFLEDIKDFEFKLLSERDYFDKETEKYRKAISTATFLKEENTKNLSDVSKARDTAKAYTGETRIKIERQASLLISLEEKLSQAEAFKNKIIDEKNKQILALKDKIFQLKDDLKNNSTLGIVQEKLTFLSANKQEVEMERDNLVNRIKTLKQSKNLIEKASTQLTVEKRGLIKDIEECKMNIEREKSQQETILTQKLKQKEEKELSFNLNQLEDIRSENEHTMETLKVIMSTNTDLSEERTRLYYDIEEIKEKKDL
jgi:hypothetical protein